MRNVLIEVCCSSLDDCIQAEKGGANRIELISCHQVSGLTPSIGTLIEVKERVNLPVVAILRPRAGGFCYTDNEMKIIMKDAEMLLKMGADGLVFGFLKEDGSIDIKKCKQLMSIIGKDRETIFHRAFDVTPNALGAAEELASLRVTRFLTSGHAASAQEGIEEIKVLVDNVGSKIEVMIGGGIREHNARKLVESTGCRQIHFSYNAIHQDSSMSHNGRINFNRIDVLPEGAYTMTDSEGVKKVAESVKGI